MSNPTFNFSESNDHFFYLEYRKSRSIQNSDFICQIFDIRYLKKIWMLDWFWYSNFKSFACFRYKTFKIWILAIHKIEILDWVIYSLFKMLDILHSKLECWIPNIKKYGYAVSTVFFEKRFLISQLIWIHILSQVSHSNGPFSRHNTTRRPQRAGGGGVSDLFFIRRLGPCIYRSPPKISGISSTPKKYSSYPQKIFIFLKTKKNIEIQNFEPKKKSLRMFENIRVPPSPPPWDGDAH